MELRTNASLHRMSVVTTRTLGQGRHRRLAVRVLHADGIGSRHRRLPERSHRIGPLQRAAQGPREWSSCIEMLRCNGEGRGGIRAEGGRQRAFMAARRTTAVESARIFPRRAFLKHDVA